MLKAIMNPDQHALNSFHINLKNACCPENLPASTTTSTTMGAAATVITSATLTFKRHADATNETLVLEGAPFADVHAMRKELAAKLIAAGYEVQTKSDVDVTGNVVTITGEIIPVNLITSSSTTVFA